MNQNVFLLGAHLSTTGGLYRAIERATAIGCKTLQIFIKNNRQWNAKPLTLEEIDSFKKNFTASCISPDLIFAHATYLINIGSANPLIEEKSIKALIDEINRCEKLDIRTLVLHPGSYTGSTLDETIKRIIANLKKVFAATNNTVMILLETTAGQGSVVGSTFEQLGAIMDACNEYENRLGICLDTCHIFAAGYCFDTQSTYQKMWSLFDDIIGLEKLRLIHLNDSKSQYNSRVDRHQNIGKGLIPLEAFSLLCNDIKLQDVPKILETPNSTEFDYIPDMQLLKSLIK